MKRLWGRKVSDYGFADFRLKIKWQAQKRGKHVKQIDRWTPTSKVCHACGQVKTGIAITVKSLMTAI